MLNELQSPNVSIGIELRDMRDEVRCIFTKYEIDDMYSYIIMYYVTHNTV